MKAHTLLTERELYMLIHCGHSAEALYGLLSGQPHMKEENKKRAGRQTLTQV